MPAGRRGDLVMLLEIHMKHIISMKYLTAVFLIALSFYAYADGIIAMKIEDVVPLAELIIEAEIMDNKTSKEISKKNDEVISVRTTTDVKIKVISIMYGRSDKKEMELKYSVTVVKGILAAFPGSGFESEFKKGDICIALLSNSFELIRLEKSESKDVILKLLKNNDEHN